MPVSISLSLVFAAKDVTAFMAIAKLHESGERHEWEEGVGNVKLTKRTIE